MRNAARPRKKRPRQLRERIVQMAQEIITLECTEAKALGKPVSVHDHAEQEKPADS